MLPQYFLALIPIKINRFFCDQFSAGFQPINDHFRSLSIPGQDSSSQNPPSQNRPYRIPPLEAYLEAYFNVTIVFLTLIPIKIKKFF